MNTVTYSPSANTVALHPAINAVASAVEINAIPAIEHVEEEADENEPAS